jgi:hypothetical protein
MMRMSIQMDRRSGQPRRDAGEHGRDGRRHRIDVGGDQRRGNAAAERERALDRQVRKRQQPERDHDAEGDKCVDRALQQRHRHQVDVCVENAHDVSRRRSLVR